MLHKSSIVNYQGLSIYYYYYFNIYGTQK